MLIVLLPRLVLAQSAPPFKQTETHIRCNSYNPDRQVFFGELHLHTVYSADAVTLETRDTAASQIQESIASYKKRWNEPPSPPQIKGLFQEAIEAELLYREACRLQLDYRDRAIRARLVEKARAINSDPTMSEAALVQQALQLGFTDDVVVRRMLRQKMRLILEEDPRPRRLSTSKSPTI